MVHLQEAANTAIIPTNAAITVIFNIFDFLLFSVNTFILYLPFNPYACYINNLLLYFPKECL